jgi:DNA-directed RNA polymerase subunit RPC12/RpoP
MLNIDSAMAAAEFRFDEKSGRYISKMTPKLTAYLSNDNLKLIMEVTGYDNLHKEIKCPRGKKFKDHVIKRSRLLYSKYRKAEKKSDRERRALSGIDINIKVDKTVFTHERCAECGRRLPIEEITVDTRRRVARYICEDCERKVQKEERRKEKGK